VIESHYPEHAFHGEESGRLGEGDYRWVVDPLDGTNNFASGYSKFATAVAALYRDEPVAAAIYEPLTEDLYRAARDGGATLNAEPLTATTSLPLAHGTVALVVGLSVATDPDRLRQVRALESALREECKRVVTTWAPCIDWGLLARGSIEGWSGSSRISTNGTRGACWPPKAASSPTTRSPRTVATSEARIVR